MPRESRYNYQRKLENSWTEVEENKSNIIRLKDFIPRYNSKNFSKTPIIIQLQEQISLGTGSNDEESNYEYLLTDASEILIRNSFIYGVMYTDPIVEAEKAIKYDSSIYYQFAYWWKQVDNTNYILKYRCAGQIGSSFDDNPVFMDVFLYFYNRQIYKTPQHIS